MAAVKKRKLSTYIIGVIFFIGIVFLFFNENGIFKYMKLKKEVSEVKEQISDVEKENKKIEGEIDSLQRKVPAKIEKVAREKYDMVRKGEKTIKVKEK